jgi:hypothetical protein
MKKIFGILKGASGKKSVSEPYLSVEDVDVQMSTIATNVSQLPKYEEILDSGTNPAIWNRVLVVVISFCLPSKAGEL